MLMDSQIRRPAQEPRLLTEATRRMLANFHVTPEIVGSRRQVRLEPVFYHTPNSYSSRAFATSMTAVA